MANLYCQFELTKKHMGHREDNSLGLSVRCFQRDITKEKRSTLRMGDAIPQAGVPGERKKPAEHCHSFLGLLVYQNMSQQLLQPLLLPCLPNRMRETVS